MFDDIETVLDDQLLARIKKNSPKNISKDLFLVNNNAQFISKNLNLSNEYINVILRALNESLRWGECNMVELEEDSICIIAPIIINEKLLGGLLYYKKDFLEQIGESFSLLISSISKILIDTLRKINLTNIYYLQKNNESMVQERVNAEILHEKKNLQLDSLRKVYIYREEAMISSIKRGMRYESRKYLNEILLCIYANCHNRLDLIKAHLIEMAVMMIRGSMQLGASNISVFENSYKMLAQLSQAKNEETMSKLAVKLLEDVMDSIELFSPNPSEKKFKEAMSNLKKSFTKPNISRKSIAENSNISQKQLTKLFKQYTGEGFSENVARLRIEYACKLILSGKLTATEIAYDVGFSDQSYFSKIFKKLTGNTPLQYKKKCNKNEK